MLECLGALVERKRYTLNPSVLTRKVNIPAFMCFSVFVFVCLLVSVFELDTYKLECSYAIQTISEVKVN